MTATTTRLQPGDRIAITYNTCRGRGNQITHIGTVQRVGKRWAMVDVPVAENRVETFRCHRDTLTAAPERNGILFSRYTTN